MNDGFLMEVPVLDQVRQDVKTELGVTPEHVTTLIMQSKQEAVEDPMIQQAKKNAMAIINADFTQSSERTRILKPIESFGLDTMQRSQQKNTLMKTTIGKLSSGGAEGGEVSRSLVDLNTKMKELDPGPLDFTRKGLFGSFFNPVRAYFRKFEKADAFIERILKNMADGQRVLQQDSVALQVEQGNLRELTKKLKREIEMGSVIDAALEEQIAIAKSQGADSEHIIANAVENSEGEKRNLQASSGFVEKSEPIFNAFCYIFLSKYSPDLNPIEKTWAIIKNRLRLHMHKSDSFWSALCHAFN